MHIPLCSKLMYRRVHQREETIWFWRRCVIKIMKSTSRTNHARLKGLEWHQGACSRKAARRPFSVLQKPLSSHTLTSHSTQLQSFYFPWLLERLSRRLLQHLTCIIVGNAKKIVFLNHTLTVSNSDVASLNDWNLQVHEKGCGSLTPISCVEFINEIVVMRVIFLPHFIVKNVKTFSVLCW